MNDKHIQEQFDKLLGMKSEKEDIDYDNFEIVYKSPNGLELFRFRFARWKHKRWVFGGYVENLRTHWVDFVKICREGTPDE